MHSSEIDAFKQLPDTIETDTWKAMDSWRFWKNIKTYKAYSGSTTRQDYLLLELYFRIIIMVKYWKFTETV